MDCGKSTLKILLNDHMKIAHDKYSTGGDGEYFRMKDPSLTLHHVDSHDFEDPIDSEMTVYSRKPEVILLQKDKRRYYSTSKFEDPWDQKADIPCTLNQDNGETETQSQTTVCHASQDTMESKSVLQTDTMLVK